MCRWTRDNTIFFFGIVAVAVGLLLGFTGCASGAKTWHNETHWDQDENGELHEVKVEIGAKTRSGLFGKVEEGVHDVAAMWSEEKDTVRLGQQARGVDNTGQIAALEVAAPVAELFINALLKALLFAPVTAGPFNENQVSELNEAFDRVFDRLKLLEKGASFPSTGIAKP